MTVSNAFVGNPEWREFQRVLAIGRGEGFDRLPGGGAQLQASPGEGASMLPDLWVFDVAYAAYVIYHYATPVAWIDGIDGEWVVPNVDYSATTTACQNRIRRAVQPYRDTPAIHP